jgi:uncharacterized DUF497 family protein
MQEVPGPGFEWDEYRELMVAQSASGRLLAIAYTIRGERRRIISARIADADEARSYHGYED